jgi:hypothetical protein
VRSLEAHRRFLRGVYGDALDLSALEDRDGMPWQYWWERQERVRIRLRDGSVKDGTVEITRGPTPYFLLRRHAGSARGGYRLTRADRVIGVQIHGKYFNLERK